MSAPKPVRLTLGLFAQWCGASVEFSRTDAARVVRTVWNDSRKVGNGDVFVAIATENDDGHKYVTTALEKGAVAAVVAKKKLGTFTPTVQKRLIAVSDPVVALQKCASRYRQELGQLLIAVTGSSGKTTTRSFITGVLEAGMPVASTVGNWNNHIGVPLSILRFTGEEYATVLEMGANHMGEITPLSLCARPDIAVITNIGYAHVGLFGSLANTVKAKFEITAGLDKKKGFLLINGDDARLRAGARASGARTVTYGFSSGCDFRASALLQSPKGISFTVAGEEYTLGMAGRHFAYAALPAVFLGLRCGLPPSMIRTTLAAMKPAQMRGGVVKKKGISFIVDCYNANPSSMDVALELLADSTEPGNRIAVVGDMRELGRFSRALHTRLGKRLAGCGLRGMVAVGEHAQTISDGAIKAGMTPRSVRSVKDAVAAATALRAMARTGDTVLLKASRLVKLEKVLDLF